MNQNQFCRLLLLSQVQATCATSCLSSFLQHANGHRIRPERPPPSQEFNLRKSERKKYSEDHFRKGFLHFQPHKPTRCTHLSSSSFSPSSPPSRPPTPASTITAPNWAAWTTGSVVQISVSTLLMPQVYDYVLPEKVAVRCTLQWKVLGAICSRNTPAHLE